MPLNPRFRVRNLSIFISARQLATHYWQRQDRVPTPMTEDAWKKNLDATLKHEGIFWDCMSDKDEIRQKLQAVQAKLDSVTKPCFEEPMKTYSIFTKQWFTQLIG